MSSKFIFGEIPVGWHVKNLINVTTFISRGKQPKYVEFSPIRTLNQKAIKWFDLQEEYFKYHNSDIKVLEKYFIQENDVVLNSTGTGTVGRCFHFDYQPNNLFADSHVTIIRTNPSELNSRFLMYQLSTKAYQEFILSAFISGSTGQVEFNKTKVQQLPILLPSIEEQSRITKLLYSLDKKIELNNKLNRTLEETAKTIFKHWFVNFEFPNESGEPYKSNGGKFVDSEFGKIPERWKVVSLGSISKITTGKTPSTKNVENFGSDYPFITPSDINQEMFILDTARMLSKVGESAIKNYKIKPFSIGVSCIGSNLGEVYITYKEAFTNQQINTIEPLDIQLYPYLFILLKNKKQDFQNMSSGSAVPIINKTAFSKVNIILPVQDIIIKYYEAVFSLFEQVKANLEQNHQLINIRNILLPKLMSGEVRVSEAEEEVEKCLQKSN